jgi:hypothetical protein
MNLSLREGYSIKFGMKFIAVIIPAIITALCFIALLVNWCDEWLLPLIRKLFLTILLHRKFHVELA